MNWALLCITRDTEEPEESASINKLPLDADQQINGTMKLPITVPASSSSTPSFAHAPTVTCLSNIQALF
jgi:hypothetical protein